ncbi:MAG TPA: ATP-binding protein [Campylobacterales bacterium]|nr:ATP-binding protein [Arcobacter sp.]HHB93913.1 ATP-binding protein [Campylobacterales bacterium]HHD80731.1 ATP-binding protein [Campylobacterales bacterium]
MLVNFRVENFKSFKEMTEFSMEATKLKNLQDSNTFDINNVSLLKSAVIYGANASGKSSLLDGINTLKSIIENSLDIDKTKRYVAQPFLLNSETEEKETFFEIQFIIDEIMYRYGFEISINAKILNEWLYQKKLQPKAREIRLFEREKQDIILGTLFKEGNLLIDKTRDNALFLSVVAQFNGEISEKIFKWFGQFNILSNIRSDDFKHYSFDKLENDKFKDKIVNFIKSADIGIYDILKKKISFDELIKGNSELEELPKFIIEEMKKNGLSSIETVHMQYNKANAFDRFKSFDLDFESDGTQKLLALTAPIIETLQNGEILIIDELDNSLHTELVKAIVQLFNSKETNPNNAQLIFTTHDTNLLNQKFFRRDQIWFTDKNIYGISNFYSLIEYGKGKTRDDLVLEKNYLGGMFGAIPKIALYYEVD